MSVEVFGQIIDPSQIEAAVEATLDKWLPTYLAEVADQNDDTRGQYETIATYSRVNSADEKLLEDQLPGCLIVCPGFSRTPEVQGDGSVTAGFAVGVSIIISSTDKEDTRNLTSRYTMAVMASLIQHPSLGDVADSLKIEDFRSDVILDESDTRTIACGYVTFEIMVGNVLNILMGPPQAEPKSDPNEDYLPSVVETTEVTIQPQEISL